MANLDNIETLFRANYADMVVLATRMLHDANVAKDIVHDIFARLLNKDIQEVNSMFLLNGVRFACLNYIRNRSLHERIYNLYSLELKNTENLEYLTEENTKRLHNLIEKALTEGERDAIKKKFFEHKTYKEMAEELSISEVAVYKRLHKAINKLRQLLSGHEG